MNIQSSASRATIVNSSRLENPDDESYRLIVECANDMISIHDESGLYTFASPACIELLGYTPSEMVGMNPFKIFHPGDYARIADHHRASLVNPSAPPISYRLRRKDHTYRSVETTSKTQTTATGEKITVCITRDTSDRERLVQELERANEMLKKIASSDALTGAANRRKFDERLKQLVLESSRGRPVSLIVCDIDYFKVLNDTHGHQAGDNALIQIAKLLMGECREMDTVCRIGGEEFAILLPGCGIEGAVGLAERMRTAIEEMSSPYGPITTSFGVCEALSDADSAESLFSRADRALYAAKANGRNRVERSKSKMEESPKRLD
ncbi:MAG: diguanylate cyclase [Rhodobacterales bacterium]|nr:diguanylate cyclase [Rhodobacterales bacterium]